MKKLKVMKSVLTAQSTDFLLCFVATITVMIKKNTGLISVTSYNSSSLMHSVFQDCPLHT